MGSSQPSGNRRRPEASLAVLRGAVREILDSVEQHFPSIAEESELAVWRELRAPARMGYPLSRKRDADNTGGL